MFGQIVVPCRQKKLVGCIELADSLALPKMYFRMSSAECKRLETFPVVMI
jgi:hypothetical protein